MVLRRLSITSKPPRYVPLPTRDKYDEPIHYPASTSSTTASTSASTSTITTNVTSTITSPCSLNDPKDPLSSPLYPPSPSSISWWPNSLSSSISRLSRYPRHLVYVFLEHGPTDKLFSHFRPRKLFIVTALASIVSATLLILSFLSSPSSPFSITHWWNSTKSGFDQEDSFRWNSINYKSDLTLINQKQIPFLLNRFGYDPPPSSQSYSNSDPIPSILHVVPPGKGVFSYLQWFSISSGVKQIRPIRTIAHMISGTVPEPGSNFWWDEVMRLPGFEIIQVEDPQEVFGNPLLDISHKSDVIRLKALQEYGGVYIDTDVIVLRPFDELMTGDEEIVLGVEKAEGTFQNPTEINGLCNAVIVSKRDSKFLKTWWENYRTFRGRPFRGGGVWNYHSVKLPWILAKNASESHTPVTVLDHKSFFTPLWDDPGLKWVHGTLQKPEKSKPQLRPAPSSKIPQGVDSEGTEALKPPSSRFRMTLAELRRPLSAEDSVEDSNDVEKLQHGELAPDLAGFGLESTGQYAYHMWHHLLDERISIATDGLLNSAKDLTPEDCLNRDSSFNRVARKYLNPAVLRRYWNFKHQDSLHLSSNNQPPTLSTKSTIPLQQ